MIERQHFVKSVILSTIVSLGLFSAACYGQDDKTAEKTSARKRYRPSPVVTELVKASESWDSSIAVASITALRGFTRVRSSRLSGNAKDALKELEKSALEWGKPFMEPSIKDFIAFKKVEIKHSDLIKLHLIRPKAIAFVDMDRLDDYEISVLDQLDSLENLTVENCRLCEGYGFKDTRLTNLKILHLNGSDIDDSSLRWFKRKNLPNLVFINLTNTDVSKKKALEFKARMESNGRKLQLKLDK